MFAWNDETWGIAANVNGQSLTLPEIGHGFMTGSTIATPNGWRFVEALSVGDEVMTFDGGAQRIVDIRRHYIYTHESHDQIEYWPIHVPTGALSNLKDMMLLPNQAVMIESDAAEEVYGDPFALVPAASLEGLRKIARVKPSPRVEVISLSCARDQILFTNGNTLCLCRKSRDMMDELFGRDQSYRILPMDQAELLVDLMEIDDGLIASGQGHLRA
ncbi:hypothetical protein HCZ30_07870 [Marivivens donghaensis]|uniref:Hedgehog/Intein (Hint) domain-containing protein n=1 Tax=Marivivens donghaensis TaxID=1699413 RepID=A0ABX0VWA2_9RHOB|nr:MULTISPECIES: Hint domain-containing protein [Marivivens]NIY72353.1 hypothetical protein [Marivivens donghaensis]